MRADFSTNCVLGNLRDLLSFCDLSILSLTALSFIFSMQVLYCATLSLQAIHCVDIDLFSYLFVRHHHQILFLVQFALQRSHKNVFLLYFNSEDTFGALKVAYFFVV